MLVEPGLFSWMQPLFGLEWARRIEFLVGFSWFGGFQRKLVLLGFFEPWFVGCWRSGGRLDGKCERVGAGVRVRR